MANECFGRARWVWELWPGGAGCGVEARGGGRGVRFKLRPTAFAVARLQ